MTAASFLVLTTCVAGAAALSGSVNGAVTRTISRLSGPMMAEASAGPDKRKDMAKARRAVLSDGGGGMTNSRAKAKRSEQKKPASGKGFGTTGTGLLYNRKPSLNAKCACDLDKTYSECCSPMHEGADAATPEELVRARYTAYAYRLPDFLMATTDPEGSEYEADAAGWKRSLLGFCDDFEFQELSVGEVKAGKGQISDESGGATAAELAQADFRVNFAQKGTLNLMVLKESSTFRKVDGKWLYASGEVAYEAQEVEMTAEEKVRLEQMKAAQQKKDS